MSETRSGRFITLEGGEGVGKSTQARLLAGELGRRGIEVLVTREPGGSDGAEAIRELLLQGEATRWNAHAETLLFAAARADHVEKKIAPALGTGMWVVCDRFIDSTRAYQGATGIDDAAILALHGFGTRGLLPDRTFVLTLEARAAAARAAARDGAANDRFGSRGAPFHSDVDAAFRRLAYAEPARVRLIDAAGPPEAVTALLIDGIADLLP